ncbi:glycoside hydrolase [Pseudovirgaria hyperparasitica]|uniref:endo-polygalacturonase n=1 Tax=Pseudovirgaria hyperparasitica TaxID=470096 RepID=A0A6A6W524_9PEZI|nr:glycoside hydrolase [Pseudovirgaria hyperparasitica]KAF2757030.1 glycoside hydrolase [Pseudovirgaria hyperparasitica]
MPYPYSKTATSCTVTEYASVSAAVASCTAITLKSITVPAGDTLDLTKLKAGSKVTFSGTTTFEYVAEDFDPVKITGSGVEITGDSSHVIDGNGSAWWDGQGSNGGTTKPDHFIVLSKLVANSHVHGLNIKNWPTHCFQITGAKDLIIENIYLDNSAGDAPNSKSGGKAAAHNSDGFDISSSTNVVLRNSIVKNQDDCVAVTSGTNITVSGLTCSGGHGLSIGSVGGKSNNTVSGITFSDSTISNSENGARIKTNSGTTGSVENIVYTNIKLSNISDYGIDIQQDYLNGGPTGVPTNGVTIKGVTMSNITGTATSDAKNYYILCGSGSCSDFTFNGISITGGTGDSCNYSPAGDFKCA